MLYCTKNAPSHLAKVYNAKTARKDKKIKFSMQVPLGIRQTIELDKENKNT